MRRILVAAILIVFFSPLVSAETYVISGKATYADNSPVSLDYVLVECENGNTQCYQYRGTKAMTNAYGEYTLVLDADSEEDGLEILLTLRGENFSHIIDLESQQSSNQGSVIQDIKLSQYPPPSGVFMGFGCVIVLFVLVFVSVLLRTGRRLTTREGRMEFVGFKKARQLKCPKCNEIVLQHELIKHLIIDHDLEALDAAEITGKVMRRTWSEEE
ncbi:MAG: hypothetical protein HOI28_05165 [Euryarchaeota archaeon]|jgi:hypothetical protein|nr:hypothetical protein [Euryarchaeota archaeon]MBT4924409.1 hypothetical protein [Euryarchaeota archaeon]MBT5736212.1 hypothetical protein [Euryarchaeota archaeon]